MRRRERPPSGGYLLSGKVYATEAEYLAALDKRDARRRRWLRLVNEDEEEEE